MTRYQRVAVFALNFFILFVLLNLLLGVGYSVADRLKPTGVAAAGQFEAMIDQHRQVDLDAYGDVPRQDVEEVLDDFTRICEHGLDYAPWTGMQFTPYASRLVNMRADIPDIYLRPMRPGTGTGRPLRVYALGGSTTFGWDVADDWCMPAYLQEALQARYPGRRVEVTNYGVPGFYSSQELAVLVKLLRTGHKPDAVVFLDGFNDCLLLQQNDSPPMTDLLRMMTRQMQQKRPHWIHFAWLPVFRLALSLRPPVTPPPADPESVRARTVETYTGNVRMIRGLCAAYGIRPYFFWQPVAFYPAGFERHVKTFPAFIKTPAVVAAYEAVRRSGTAEFLGDMTAGSAAPDKLFIDLCHYSPAFNRTIAQVMASRMDGL